MKLSRVLIVDDKEENRYLLRAMLQGNGYEVAAATQGAEALDMARQNQPDLIIADILMPVMDGFTLCREWKKDERLKPIPFVFYTATYTDERDREFALSLGAERFIVKPVEPDEFMAIIRETIQQVESPPAVRAKPAADATAQLTIGAPEEEVAVYLRQYNEALIRKLEAKMEQLEQANRMLEQDVCARRTAEEALAASEEMFRLLVENAPDAVFVQTRGIWAYANPTAMELLRASSKDQLIGKSVMDTIHPDCRETVRERMHLANVQKKSVPAAEQKYIRLDGTTADVETSAVPIRYHNEDGALVFVRDITERKHAEAERTRIEKQLRQAQKMEALGTLAGGIAHDFNNILAIIMGYTDMAKLALSEDSPVLNKLNEVLKATDRAKELVKQILAFSRKTEHQKVPLQLGAIVKEAMKILRPSLPSTIEIRTDVLCNADLLADPTQMHQVLMNLCTNAAHAMQDKGGVLEIRLADIVLGTKHDTLSGSLQPGCYAELTVKDNGHGIDPAILDSIFDPFFTTKDSGEGTGLGLSVVHGIIESHGGAINVESLPGKGTTFTVLIPIMEEDRGPEKVDPALALPRGQERVLVVDDEPVLAEMVKQMLEELGYDVVSRTSGIESLEALRHQSLEKRFELVVTDMTMPHFTGTDLARELSRFDPAIPVILMTGFSNKIDAEKAEGLGIQGFLMKPVALEELAITVRMVLDRRTN